MVVVNGINEKLGMNNTWYECFLLLNSVFCFMFKCWTLLWLCDTLQWQPEVWSQFCQEIYWRPGQKGAQENRGTEEPDESPQQQGWPHGEQINFNFDKCGWLWSNQHPDAVHIHDICLQFHDFIKIELYVQKFKFRHNIVPTNLVHSSMRLSWEQIWLFPHVDIKSTLKLQL